MHSDSIRKLAIIVFTNIVDFTRLSADNEPVALRLVNMSGLARKLATIVFTNIVGFTQISVENESLVIKVLGTQRIMYIN